VKKPHSNIPRPRKLKPTPQHGAAPPAPPPASGDNRRPDSAIAADPAHRKQPKSTADEELITALATLLTGYTLGTLLDAAWATGRQLFAARRKEA